VLCQGLLSRGGELFKVSRRTVKVLILGVRHEQFPLCVLQLRAPEHCSHCVAETIDAESELEAQPPGDERPSRTAALSLS